MFYNVQVLFNEGHCYVLIVDICQILIMYLKICNKFYPPLSLSLSRLPSLSPSLSLSLSLYYCTSGCGRVAVPDRVLHQSDRRSSQLGGSSPQFQEEHVCPSRGQYYIVEEIDTYLQSIELELEIDYYCRAACSGSCTLSIQLSLKVEARIYCLIS